jgi:phosphoglycerate dehydrogenase-like enzyme
VRKLLMAATHRFPLWKLPVWLPARIQSRFPELNVVHLDGYRHIDVQIPDAEIYVGFILPPASLALAQQLRWMHATAAGVDQLCYPEMLRHPSVLTNSSTVMAEPVAEHCLALMLALAKRIPSAMRYQGKAFWAQTEVSLEEPSVLELQGAVLGLVGLGGIGQEVAKRARAFGMRVVAVKRDTSTGGEWADRVLPPAALHEMLSEADFVVLAAPHTGSTQRLMGAAEFAAMKRSAYLINVARGTLVNDAALLDALRSGRIAGAASDVFDPEPLPPESPLWTAPNMLITPHTAASTSLLWKRHAELLEDNISRYLEGRPLRNVVDKSLGY